MVKAGIPVPDRVAPGDDDDESDCMEEGEEEGPVEDDEVLDVEAVDGKSDAFSNAEALVLEASNASEESTEQPLVELTQRPPKLRRMAHDRSVIEGKQDAVKVSDKTEEPLQATDIPRPTEQQMLALQAEHSKPPEIQNQSIHAEPKPTDIQNPSIQSKPKPVVVQNPSIQSEPKTRDVQNPSIQSEPKPADGQNPSIQSEPKPELDTEPERIQQNAPAVPTKKLPTPLNQRPPSEPHAGLITIASAVLHMHCGCVIYDRSTNAGLKQDPGSPTSSIASSIGANKSHKFGAMSACIII